MLTKDHVDHFLLSGIIARAERTLAESKRAGYRGRASVRLEALLARLHDERRAILDSMMQAPFEPARHDGA